MKNILVSGLINIETTLCIDNFPVDYSPIDYRFFGVNSNISGVATNISYALKSLENDVNVLSLLGDDFYADIIEKEFSKKGLNTDVVLRNISATPCSIVLYDNQGKRKIYCDLKDIQESVYPVDKAKAALEKCDIAVLCNINFNRRLLSEARRLNKIIATDVHILSDIDDEYNRDFLSCSQIVFLSDEGIPENCRINFLSQLKNKYNMQIIVLGCGSDGAILYDRKDNAFYNFGAVKNNNVVNTVGAGDALFSSFINYYLKGFTSVECLKRAEIFASAKISCNGASIGFISEKQIEEQYKTICFDIKKQTL